VDGAELLDFIPGAQGLLERAGLGIQDALSEIRLAIRTALDGQTICSKKQLDQVLAANIRARLSVGTQASWDEPSGFGRGQGLGEAVVSFCLRPAALEGLVCFADRRGGETCFARTDQWLGEDQDQPDDHASQRLLVLAYLGSCAPTSTAEMAAWAGIRPRQARRLWSLVEDRLVRVAVDGKRRWMLAEDLPALENAVIVPGVRLLPAHDPFIQIRDRSSLAPDCRIQREIWKTTSSPGVILVDGSILGTWRSRKTGRKMELTARLFASPTRIQKSLLKVEAESLAAFLGCPDCEVRFENPAAAGL
jgi:hypothetical protein